MEGYEIFPKGTKIEPGDCFLYSSLPYPFSPMFFGTISLYEVYRPIENLSKSEMSLMKSEISAIACTLSQLDYKDVILDSCVSRLRELAG